MTTTQPTTTAPAPVAAPPAGRVSAPVSLPVERLTARLVRRSSGFLALAAAAYMAMEVLSYRAAYPDQASREQIARLSESAAVRALQGVPEALTTAGGFAVWDAGWLLSLIVGTWALLLATRLLRGEEDAGRVELLLVGPARARHVTALVLLVVAACCVGVGAAVSAALLASGSGTAGSLLFGVGLAGFAATFAGVAAVASQVLDVRRRAAGCAAAFLGAAFLLRMVANSTDGRAWLGWFTPFGWLDRLEPFGDPQGVALAVLVVVPVLLLVVAAQARDRRDTGGALLGSQDGRRPRLGGLGRPVAFAWRMNRPALTGWVLGLAAYAFVMGALVTTMIEFLARDASYQRALADLGLDVALTVEGFVGVMSLTLGAGFALYAAFRVGAVRSEEESGRADNLLARPLSRTRWLLGHAVLTVVGAALLVVLTGLAMWTGAAVSGSDRLTVGEPLRGVLNTGSVVVLVTGLAVLSFGLRPRLTVSVPAAVTVGGYVLTLLGPALSWPGWVVDLSPFSHLAYVPAEPFAAASAAVMVLVGCAAGAAGVAAFAHRDVSGA